MPKLEAMTVGTLKEKLKDFPDDTPLVVDHDENGWFNLENLEKVEYGDGEIFANLVSSNEGQ